MTIELINQIASETPLVAETATSSHRHLHFKIPLPWCTTATTIYIYLSVKDHKEIGFSVKDYADARANRKSLNSSSEHSNIPDITLKVSTSGKDKVQVNVAASHEGFMAWGKTLHEQNKYVEAGEKCKEALELKPGTPGIKQQIFLIAHSLSKDGQTEKAKNLLKSLLPPDDQDFTHEATRKLIDQLEGDDSFKNGDYIKALEFYRKAGQSDEILLQRAQDILKKAASQPTLDDYDSAMQFVENVNSNHAKSIKFQCLEKKAQLHEKYSTYDKAIECISLARTISPENKPSLDALQGRILTQQENYQGALKYFKKGDNGYEEALRGMAGKYIKEARDCLNGNDANQALKFCDEFDRIKSSLDSKSKDDLIKTACKIKGLSYQKLGDNKKALEFLSTEDSGYQEARKALGLEYAAEADQLKQAKKYAESNKEYEEALKTDPNNPNYQYGSFVTNGYMSINEGKFKDAINYFIKANSLKNNKDLECSEKLAELYIIEASNEKDAVNSKGNYEKAVESLRGLASSSEQIKHLMATACNELGKYYYDRENYVKAQEYFKMSCEAEPINIIFRNNYGWSLIELGDFKGAIDVLNPLGVDIAKQGLAIAYNRYGHDYLINGKVGDAFQYFVKALELFPEDIVYLNNLGYCHLELKEYEEAKEIFSKKLLEHNDRAKQGKEIALTKLINNTKDPEKHKEYYKELVKIIPDKVSYIFNLAKVYAAGQEEDDIVSLSTCLGKIRSIDPSYENNSDFIDMLGIVPCDT